MIGAPGIATDGCGQCLLRNAAAPIVSPIDFYGIWENATLAMTPHGHIGGVSEHPFHLPLRQEGIVDKGRHNKSSVVLMTAQML
jgi:hypothetical protein